VAAVFAFLFPSQDWFNLISETNHLMIAYKKNMSLKECHRYLLLEDDYKISNDDIQSKIKADENKREKYKNGDRTIVSSCELVILVKQHIKDPNYYTINAFGYNFTHVFMSYIIRCNIKSNKKIVI